MPGRGYSGDSTRFLGRWRRAASARLHDCELWPALLQLRHSQSVTVVHHYRHRPHVHSQFLAGKLHFLAVAA
jgi:hypothetical protein